jgi:hypothetical protein
MPRGISPTPPAGGINEIHDDIEVHPIWGEDDADIETVGIVLKA